MGHILVFECSRNFKVVLAKCHPIGDYLFAELLDHVHVYILQAIYVIRHFT